MKILYIELSDCILCEICTEMCPSVFRSNEAGFIEIFDVAEGDVAAVQEAIKYCPADCIHWDETSIDIKKGKKSSSGIKTPSIGH
jgi:ferredoxin